MVAWTPDSCTATDSAAAAMTYGVSARTPMRFMASTAASVRRPQANQASESPCEYAADESLVRHHETTIEQARERHVVGVVGLRPAELVGQAPRPPRSPHRVRPARSGRLSVAIRHYSGGGGIRTHGRPNGRQRFSRPPRSTTPAPLRGTSHGRRRRVPAPAFAVDSATGASAATRRSRSAARRTRPPAVRRPPRDGG